MEDGHFKIQQKHLRGEKALAIRLNADAVWHQHVSYEEKGLEMGFMYITCSLYLAYGF